MQVSIDLPRDQIDALAKLGEVRGSSRAPLIREAVTEYLDRHQPGGLDEAFGLWRTPVGEPEDGVTYQRRLRDEWK